MESGTLATSNGRRNGEGADETVRTVSHGRHALFFKPVAASFASLPSLISTPTTLHSTSYPDKQAPAPKLRGEEEKNEERPFCFPKDFGIQKLGFPPGMTVGGVGSPCPHPAPLQRHLLRDTRVSYCTHRTTLGPINSTAMCTLLSPACRTLPV